MIWGFFFVSMIWGFCQYKSIIIPNYQLLETKNPAISWVFKF